MEKFKKQTSQYGVINTATIDEKNVLLIKFVEELRDNFCDVLKSMARTQIDDTFIDAMRDTTYNTYFMQIVNGKYDIIFQTNNRYTEKEIIFTIKNCYKELNNNIVVIVYEKEKSKYYDKFNRILRENRL